MGRSPTKDEIMRLATPEQNKITIKKDGATFYGRVVPQEEIKVIRDKCKKPPEKAGDPLDLDEEEFVILMFDAHVTGWEGLADFSDCEIPYEKGKIRELERMNAGFAKQVLVDLHSKVSRIRSREDEAKEAEIKN